MEIYNVSDYTLREASENLAFLFLVATPRPLCISLEVMPGSEV
jgi:hypothetical protein